MVKVKSFLFFLTYQLLFFISCVNLGLSLDWNSVEVVGKFYKIFVILIEQILKV